MGIFAQVTYWGKALRKRRVKEEEGGGAQLIRDVVSAGVHFSLTLHIPDLECELNHRIGPTRR